MTPQKEPHRGIVVLSPKLKLAPEDLQALRDAGYVPVIGKPHDVQVLSGFSQIDGNMLNIAAIRTCAKNDQRHQEFGKLVLNSMIAELDGTP